MEQYSKDQFINICKKSADIGEERKVLYNFLVDCFKRSDVNYDGSVDPVEFDAMIENASAAARNHGLSSPATQIYKSVDERQKARAALFKAMDENNDGQISLDEWIGFCLKEIFSQLK